MASTAPSPIPAKPRTLIVEDDRVASGALLRLLGRDGYELALAETCRQAVEKLQEWGPRFLLLDLMLPDGNGVEVLELIRRERLAVKVAVLTAVGDPVVLAIAQAFNPDGFFRKPADFGQLRMWLDGAA